MTHPEDEMSGELSLEPCPFCGSAKVDDHFVRDGRRVACGCGASIVRFHGKSGDTRADVRAAWNTRSPPSPAKTEADDLREAADALVNGFAWSAVTPDCPEAGENLQGLIDRTRAALTLPTAIDTDKLLSFAHQVGRLTHSQDDGFAWPEGDNVYEAQTMLDSLIATVRGFRLPVALPHPAGEGHEVAQDHTPSREDVARVLEPHAWATMAENLAYLRESSLRRADPILALFGKGESR